MRPLVRHPPYPFTSSEQIELGGETANRLSRTLLRLMAITFTRPPLRCALRRNAGPSKSSLWGVRRSRKS